MLMTDRAEYQRYRAPTKDGQTLVDPPRSTLAELVARNRRHLAELDYDVQGRPLAELAASARRRLVAAALAYTRQYRDVATTRAAVEQAADVPLIFSGHQPQLFHPGVWYKNFLLGGLADEVGGLGIHLLIDSDLCRAASIRVPTGSVDEPRVEAVPFDQPALDMPYEERHVRDESTFSSFSDRVVDRIRPLVARPVVEELWPLIRERTPGDKNLGLRIAKGRHALEGRLGNNTLELPQSSVCQLPEFAWFIAHVLAQLPRFWAAHNDALAAYRRAHRLRNRAVPVPDLADDHLWLEAPFWIWSTDEPRRRPVFARQQGDELLLSDRRQRTIALALSDDGSATMAAEQLDVAAARGIKIRTRALATTLFARLLLSDLFLHGIGGAKYDQVTDQIAEQFFGFRLPDFATASATLRLPIDHPPADAERLRDVRQVLRQLDYHPERFLSHHEASVADTTPMPPAAVAEKRHWVNTPKTPNNARQQHRAITSANTALQPYVASLRARFERQRVEIERRLRANAILDSREYSLCLFPRDHLAALLLDAPTTKP